jgi:hypothetical protein
VHVFGARARDHVRGLDEGPLALSFEYLAHLEYDVGDLRPVADLLQDLVKRPDARMRIEIRPDRRGVVVPREEQLERNDRIRVLAAELLDPRSQPFEVGVRSLLPARRYAREM